MERLLASFHAIPPNSSVRLAKRTSNLFRARAKHSGPGLDTSGLTGVIAVDPDARTALALPRGMGRLAGESRYLDNLPPVVTVPLRPKGEPIAMTDSPT